MVILDPTAKCCRFSDLIGIVGWCALFEIADDLEDAFAHRLPILAGVAHIAEYVLNVHRNCL